MKLFQITDTQAHGPNKTVPGLFFSNKQDARAARRKLNEVEKPPLRYVVSPGPDHYKRQPPGARS